MSLKRISDSIQNPGITESSNPHLLARKVGSGEVGIMIGYEVQSLDGPKKRTTNAIYWNNKLDALRDLATIASYFYSDEDE